MEMVQVVEQEQVILQHKEMMVEIMFLIVTQVEEEDIVLVGKMLLQVRQVMEVMEPSIIFLELGMYIMLEEEEEEQELQEVLLEQEVLVEEELEVRLQ